MQPIDRCTALEYCLEVIWVRPT